MVEFDGGSGIYTVSRDAPVTGFRTLPVGAGGFITNLVMANDGTKFIRTDTYGCYLTSGPITNWVQLLTAYSMPSNDPNVGYQNGNGVCAVGIAPNNSRHLYMVYSGDGALGGPTAYFYYSTTQGASWARSSQYGPYPWNPNDSTTVISTRLMGNFIAVDPANDFVVFVSSPSNGLFHSRDGGSTFAQVAAVGLAITDPLCSQGCGHLICFDPTSSVVGGFTQGIYVSTYGTGIFHSSDGGLTWTLISGASVASSPPGTHFHMIVDQTGTLWLTVQARGDTTIVALWRYVGGAWHNFVGQGLGTNAWSINTIAVNPFNSGLIMAGTPGSNIFFSTNNGLSWDSDIGFSDEQLLGYNDVTWIPYCDQTLPFPSGASFLGNGNQVYDPNNGFLWLAAGRGVWYSEFPATLGTPPSHFGINTAWTVASRGIEQLVSRDFTMPPGGVPLLSVGDKSEFTILNTSVYPDHNGPLGGARGQNINVLGHSIDYASADFNTIVTVCNLIGEFSSVSHDGGVTWNAFANTNIVPSNTGLGGAIAASSNGNYVWIGANNNPYIYTTTNDGNTWTQILLPGIPTDGSTTGWGFVFFLTRKIIAADRVSANTFYAYNSGASVAGPEGVYKSTDKGLTWTKVFSGFLTTTGLDSFNGHLRTVPGHAGHIFWSTGPVGSSRTSHPAAGAFLMRSTNAGVTWTAVSNVLEVTDFAFGAAAPGASYPAVFIAGFVGPTYGIWRSDDNCVTWNYMAEFPLGNFDSVGCMGASLDTYNQVFVGFTGSGFAWSTP